MTDTTLPRKKRTYAAATLTALLMAGCAQSTDRVEADKAAAQARWSDTRGGVLLALAEDQYGKGDLTRAAETAGKARQLLPDEPRLLVLVARVALEQGRTDEAAAAVDAALAADPDHAAAHYVAGTIDQRWRHTDKALAHYVAATDSDPESVANWLAVGETLVELGRDADALAMLRGKLDHFEHSAALRDAVGQLEARRGNHAAAAVLFRQASVLDRGDDTIREHLALATYEAGELAEAESVLTRLLAKDDRADRADLWAAVGESRLALGLHKEAREAFETLTGLTPGDAAAWSGLAKASLQGGDLRGADAALRRAEAVGGEDAGTHLLRGYLLLRRGDSERAATHFEQAATLDPSDPVALCMLGHARHKAGDLTDALALYDAALELAPNDPLAAQLRDELLRQRGSRQASLPID